MQWRMLQQDSPEDFVIATGRQETVRRFIELSAEKIGWGGINWEGEGLEELGHRADTGDVVVRIDPRYSDRRKSILCLVIRPKLEKTGLDTHYHPGRTCC